MVNRNSKVEAHFRLSRSEYLYLCRLALKNEETKNTALRRLIRRAMATDAPSRDL
jgi:hypothetical protein